jgi:GTP diphosphokinase / guanosine-3',5'-bis(diphosphate) 3'-diphosphatase
MSREIDKQRETSFNDSIDDFVCATEQEKAAFDFAREKHKATRRKDGSEYFTHCVAVANLVRSFGIDDSEMVVAALCHDLVEDEDVTLEELTAKFGPNVSRWVDGLTKLRGKEGKADHLETQRKVVDRAFLEPQVAIIKLADRLHNMMTMDFMSEDKQKSKSRETLDIYAPLAESLGMWRVKTWLEDLSFKYVNPEGHAWVVETLLKDPRLSETEVTNIHSHLENLLDMSGFSGNVEVQYKGLYEADRKRERSARRGLSAYDNFGYVNDLVSYRVVLDDWQEEKQMDGDLSCYTFLGVVHEAFGGRVDIKRFDDFIVSPRVNNYQALQTTINTHGGPIEVAITTRTHEDFNEWGVVGKIKTKSPDVRDFVQKIIFLPSGKVRFLPKMATGWDVAYEISPVLGEKADHILVNGERKPLSYVVPNGAVVKVEYSKNSRPVPSDAVNYVSGRTGELMREQGQKYKLRGEVAKGREKLTSVLSEFGIVSLEDLEEIDRFMASGTDWGFDDQPFVTLLMETGCNSRESLYAQIGSGSQNLDQIANILRRLGVSKESLGWSTLVLKGEDRPGILAELSGFLQEHDKNIVSIRNVSAGDKFELKMVISGLDAVSEQALREFLNTSTRYQEILLV